MKTAYTKKIGEFAFILAFILSVPPILNAQTWNVNPPKLLGRPISQSLLTPDELEKYVQDGLCNPDGSANQAVLDQLMQPKINEALRESHAAIQELGHAQAALNRARQKGPELDVAMDLIGRLKNRVEPLCSDRTVNSCNKIQEVNSCFGVKTFMQTAGQISQDAEAQLPSRFDAVQQRLDKIGRKFRKYKKWL
ncbi:MAG: hypothetical protein HY559_04160 [Gammaproteobacteria bacterium]|nr:hypothetical protein [Gammaproteobacteria bacterium]